MNNASTATGNKPDLSQFGTPSRPVIDDEGRERRLVIVVKGELTCRECGTVCVGHYCPLCDERWGQRGAESFVPTESYLHPDEYRYG